MPNPACRRHCTTGSAGRQKPRNAIVCRQRAVRRADSWHRRSEVRSPAESYCLPATVVPIVQVILPPIAWVAHGAAWSRNADYTVRCGSGHDRNFPAARAYPDLQRLQRARVRGKRDEGMYAVVGATGKLGMEICRQLVASRKPVRALVRAAAQRDRLAELQALGVRIVPGDLQDRASLEAVCRDAMAVISTANTLGSRQPHDSILASDLEGHRNLLGAARKAGVQRFVFVSLSGCMPAWEAFVQARRAVEAYVRASGLVYTILGPAPIMETWLTPSMVVDITGARARPFGSGDGKLSWIARGDVARFAITLPEYPLARDATIDVGGPDWLSQNEVIRLCEALSGRPFTVEHLPAPVLRMQLAAATDEYARAVAGLELHIAQGEGEPIDMRPVLQACPLRLVSIREYVHGVLAAQAAVPADAH